MRSLSGPGRCFALFTVFVEVELGTGVDRGDGPGTSRSGEAEVLVDVDAGIDALRLALRCVLNPRTGVAGDCGARSVAGDEDGDWPYQPQTDERWRRRSVVHM